MIYVFRTEELMFGKKGVFAKASAKLLMSVLGVNRSNRIYNRISGRDDYLDAIMEELHISCDIDSKSLANIPSEGPAVVLFNHPTGIIDGLLALKVCSMVRSDVKMLGNYIIERVEPLKKYIIPVNPFDNRTGGNLGGLKQAMQHLSDGGLLILFPAGEVDTWQDGWHGIRDKRWDRAAIKFISRSGASIVPAWITARNSVWFRLAGKIDPRLRTALLCREIFNKSGKTIPVTIGASIAASKLKELTDPEAYADYLRAMVEYLGGCREKPVRSIAEIEAVHVDLSNITEAPSTEILKAEIAAISDEHKLFDYGDCFSIYCSPPELIPNMMTEIGRMREITFRRIGEGSMNPLDLDRYDQYYHQLFIWDNSADTLVGAYRLGLGNQIVPKYGLDGFYTHSLFNYDEAMKDILTQTIELGRSFVVSDYQRKPASLLMLWKGILYMLLKHDEYRYLLGPVTISGEFQRSSKTIIVTHLRQQNFDDETSRMVHPRTGLDGIDFPINPKLIEKVESIGLIDKIVCDIEKDERAIPVLIKKYLQLNSHVLGFNVDHDFCDALDALMLLDLKLMPDSKILMLSKEIEDIDVVARFKAVAE